jgi:hypothetical protein
MSPSGVTSPSFDLAVALADRLQRECRADIVEMSAQTQLITIRLTIPARGVRMLRGSREASRHSRKRWAGRAR